jgi:hypothetical protein
MKGSNCRRPVRQYFFGRCKRDHCWWKLSLPEVRLNPVTGERLMGAEELNIDARWRNRASHPNIK